MVTLLAYVKRVKRIKRGAQTWTIAVDDTAERMEQADDMTNNNTPKGVVHSGQPLSSPPPAVAVTPATGLLTGPGAIQTATELAHLLNGRCARCASLDDLDLATLATLDHDTVAFIVSVYDALAACENDPAANAPLPQQWDQLQAALDTLHAALGGRRMGDYPPDQPTIDRAIIDVIVRLAMTGIQAEQLNRTAADHTGAS
jgi:hypothetical protein